jgi:hypothetical protein
MVNVITFGVARRDHTKQLLLHIARVPKTLDSKQSVMLETF